MSAHLDRRCNSPFSKNFLVPSFCRTFRHFWSMYPFVKGMFWSAVLILPFYFLVYIPDWMWNVVDRPVDICWTLLYKSNLPLFPILQPQNKCLHLFSISAAALLPPIPDNLPAFTAAATSHFLEHHNPSHRAVNVTDDPCPSCAQLMMDGSN